MQFYNRGDRIPNAKKKYFQRKGSFSEKAIKLILRNNRKKERSFVKLRIYQEVNT
jgi:hypothetical protein